MHVTIVLSRKWFDVSPVQTAKYRPGPEVHILVVTTKIVSYRSFNEPIKLKDTPVCILHVDGGCWILR